MHLPLSAVFVAQLAHFLLIRIFPHQCVILPWHPLWTSRHAEQSILEAGTLCTVSRTLDVGEERVEMFRTLWTSGRCYVNCFVS